MNSLYTLGLRQTSSIQADLDKMRAGDTSSSLQGQISASLSALSRTMDDYDSMAKREMIAAKQEKAYSRVHKFRQEHADLRSQFDTLKKETANARSRENRNELFGATTSIPLSPGVGPSSATARQRSFTAAPSQNQTGMEESPFSLRPAVESSTSFRESHAIREQSFLESTESQLDSFLMQGKEVLDNLVDQKNLLKGTRRKLLDAANTLGLSRDVISWVERRTTQDVVIFFVGAIFTLVCFYYIWRWFG
ncbi:golgi SNAP receptor complex member bos1 [Calocera viscosa TUFC12733]|uniref:Protein transport protein BOS1 n=1 Tax=Calocera viscosa (strain TUFC12733) TaxID=1330018 RepID=A0A167IZM6_CALVF|nr:golgi SNAP receptor complex member bos1 [Calocera viscosa TUFC12733]